jgi:alkylation response protein AidB-like acyl-CoA dehydrogenase
LFSSIIELKESFMSNATTANVPYNSTAHYMPISGDDYPLTEKQKKLMALAHDLGKHKFAPRAAQLDRDAQFPFENYKDMKDSGLLACVCQKHMAAWVQITPRMPWCRQKLVAGAVPLHSHSTCTFAP